MYQLKVNEKYSFDVVKSDKGLSINGDLINPDIKKTGESSWHIINIFHSYNIEVIAFVRAEKKAVIKVNNNVYTIYARDQYDILLDKLGLSNLNTTKVSDVKAPMPGMVLRVFVADGTVVKKGDNLFVLEAMKMENIIKAPVDFIVKSIKVEPGAKVEKNQVLILF